VNTIDSWKKFGFLTDAAGVTGPNGQLQGIYDFKFDGDDWNGGQYEMYEQDLVDSGAANQTPQKGDSATCGCDGPGRVNSKGAVG
jgi:hypothetical protein